MPFDKYNVGCYLLDRLSEVGVQDMFGVPGDFNLRFLDDVMTHSIKWIGTANELNASYAADGYARCRGIGCLVTTYGVGELSAANGIAGAYAESVPVIHIVGVPSYAQMNKRLILHHSLGDGDFLHYLRVSKELCCAAEMLTPENARHQIDKVITEVLYHKKPGYIGLPMDVAEIVCMSPASFLVCHLPAYCEESLDAFEEAATALIQGSSSCCLLVGRGVKSVNLEEVVNRFVEMVNIPYAVTFTGKGGVNEHLPNYIGTYSSRGSNTSFSGGCSTNSYNEELFRVRSSSVLPESVISTADVMISFGADVEDLRISDRFLYKMKRNQHRIRVLVDGAVIGAQRFSHIPMHKTIAVLQELCQAALENYWVPYSPSHSNNGATLKNDFDSTKSGVVNSSGGACTPLIAKDSYGCWVRFWKQIQLSLRPWDILVTDAPSDVIETAPLRLPEGCVYIIQSSYETPGYAIPAALGCQAAFPERRVICVVRDIEALKSFQELGTALRNNMKIRVILVVNSALKTLEVAGCAGSHSPKQRNAMPSQWWWIVRSISVDHSHLVTHHVTENGEVVSPLSGFSGEGMLLIETQF